MKRRKFLVKGGGTLLALGSGASEMGNATVKESEGDVDLITLFLCGDVMTGRGIDQVLPHPGNPRLHENYMKSARGYVEIAEHANGPIPKPVSFSYIWGEALEIFASRAPDVRIVNLETAVTRSDDYWKGKGIHYRMHPENVPCLSAAGIDCCVLSNNHVLDWGYAGLGETLETLEEAKIARAGAGRNQAEAEAPAAIVLPGDRRVLVFGFGSVTSGIPGAWAATDKRAGVALLEDFSDATVRRIAAIVRQARRGRDIVVASIHWGANWGYAIPRQHKLFAHRLIDEAGIDVIHGHSSHHSRGIEIYRGKPILYGCGDFLNDYEGISGHEAFRGELGCMYFVTMDAGTGRLMRFELVPTRLARFRINRAPNDDARWLRETLDRECARLGSRIEAAGKREFILRWEKDNR